MNKKWNKAVEANKRNRANIETARFRGDEEYREFCEIVTCLGSDGEFTIPITAAADYFDCVADTVYSYICMMVHRDKVIDQNKVNKRYVYALIS